MSQDFIPLEVQDRLLGLMDEDAAYQWWRTPESQWLGGISPQHLWATGKVADQTLVVDVIEAALVGAIPLEGH